MRVPTRVHGRQRETSIVVQSPAGHKCLFAESRRKGLPIYCAVVYFDHIDFPTINSQAGPFDFETLFLSGNQAAQEEAGLLSGNFSTLPLSI